MLDIYTCKPVCTPSDEHIVHNALGGRRSSALLDKTTNDAFGSTIDSELTDWFLMTRVLLDWKSGDGRDPPPLRGAAGDDGHEYSLLAGGTAEIAKPKLTFNVGAEKILVHPRVRSVEEFRRLASRKLLKHGISLEEVEASLRGLQLTASPAPLLTTNPSFGAWRAIAKIACNLLASERRSLFLESEFNPIRQFVLADGNPWDFVALNKTPIDISESEIGELDHVVVVRGDAATRRVAALVVLYGHLQFVVSLGFAAFAGDFIYTYRVNQGVRRDRSNSVDDLEIPIPPFEPLTEETLGLWYSVFEGAMNQILSVAKGRSDERAMREFVEESVNEVLQQTGGSPLTEEQVHTIASEGARRYLDMLRRGGRQ